MYAWMLVFTKSKARLFGNLHHLKALDGEINQLNTLKILKMSQKVFQSVRKMCENVQCAIAHRTPNKSAARTHIARTFKNAFRTHIAHVRVCAHVCVCEFFSQLTVCEFQYLQLTVLSYLNIESREFLSNAFKHSRLSFNITYIQITVGANRGLIRRS